MVMSPKLADLTGISIGNGGVTIGGITRSFTTYMFCSQDSSGTISAKRFVLSSTSTVLHKFYGSRTRNEAISAPRSSNTPPARCTRLHWLIYGRDCMSKTPACSLPPYCPCAWPPGPLRRQ